jgi:hypothetical protein
MNSGGLILGLIRVLGMGWDGVLEGEVVVVGVGWDVVIAESELVDERQAVYSKGCHSKRKTCFDVGTTPPEGPGGELRYLRNCAHGSFW